MIEFLFSILCVIIDRLMAFASFYCHSDSNLAPFSLIRTKNLSSNRRNPKNYLYLGGKRNA